MAEPRIQYAKTTDGVSIAFWTLGEGMPLVHVPLVPFGHMQLEWQMEEVRRWYESLAQGRMLIGYDRRGTGLSDRDVVNYSLDAQVLDLEAIVERLGITQFALFAGLYLGPAAIAYASRHRDKVTHLLLWCTSPRAPKTLSDVRYDLLDPLMETDWERYTETRVHWTVGWENTQEARKYAALLREGSTPKSFRAYQRAMSEFDASALLNEVQSPTLVLHMRSGGRSGLNAARELASQIPDARLTAVEGSLPYPWMGRQESALTAIDEFLGESETSAAPPEPQAAVVTILFTDLTSSTALTQRLGDAKAQELVRAHNTIVREALAAQGGSEIKHTGDGIMASFPTASGALECAVAIQRAVALRQAQGGDAESLAVHIGLNAGEPVAEESDLFGTSVQLARRICDHAESGQILVSNVVRELSAGKGFLFADIGEVVPKGFDEAVRLYEVRWRDE